MTGYIDVPYEAIFEAYAKLMKKDKEQVCRVLPSVRFFWDDCGYHHPDLICDRVDGDSTGCAAECCKNCVLKHAKKG